MKRKIVLLMLLLILLVPNFSYAEVNTQDEILVSLVEPTNRKIGKTFDKDEYILMQDKGSLIINFEPSKEGLYKVWITKDGVFTSYVLNNGITEIPFSLGQGIYKIEILKHKKANKYTIRARNTFEVTSLKETDVYLGNHEKVNWKKSSKTTKLAKELTKDSKTSKDMVNKIYDYIVQNIDYDYAKLNNYPDNYLPNLDDILLKQKSICYDYASLFAGMLRSIGISTKLVMGYVKGYDGSFHAWNEVYLDGKWIVVDTTFDAGYRALGIKYEMDKVSGDYRGVKWY
ncbi:MAG: transglutaminase-like domain-containing protein [Tissierellaceae bacterium]|nr:transglutaminase-like domain-containing protein [Tissierellaceae bacterium]